jgi:hypothetical protein
VDDHPGKPADTLALGFALLGFAEIAAIRRKPRRAELTPLARHPGIDAANVLYEVLRRLMIDPVHRHRRVIVVQRHMHARAGEMIAERGTTTAGKADGVEKVLFRDGRGFHFV